MADKVNRWVVLKQEILQLQKQANDQERELNALTKEFERAVDECGDNMEYYVKKFQVLKSQHKHEAMPKLTSSYSKFKVLNKHNYWAQHFCQEDHDEYGFLYKLKYFCVNCRTTTYGFLCYNCVLDCSQVIGCGKRIELRLKPGSFVEKIYKHFMPAIRQFDPFSYIAYSLNRRLALLQYLQRTPHLVEKDTSGYYAFMRYGAHNASYYNLQGGGKFRSKNEKENICPKCGHIGRGFMCLNCIIKYCHVEKHGKQIVLTYKADHLLKSCIERFYPDVNFNIFNYIITMLHGKKFLIEFMIKKEAELL